MFKLFVNKDMKTLLDGYGFKNDTFRYLSVIYQIEVIIIVSTHYRINHDNLEKELWNFELVKKLGKYTF